MIKDELAALSARLRGLAQSESTRDSISKRLSGSDRMRLMAVILGVSAAAWQVLLNMAAIFWIGAAQAAGQPFAGAFFIELALVLIPIITFFGAVTSFGFPIAGGCIMVAAAAAYLIFNPPIAVAGALVGGLPGLLGIVVGVERWLRRFLSVGNDK